MATNELVKNSEKYCGKWVATKSFWDNDVVCSGRNPKVVYVKAKRAGLVSPIVLYIPEKNSIHVY